VAIRFGLDWVLCVPGEIDSRLPWFAHYREQSLSGLSTGTETSALGAAPRLATLDVQVARSQLVEQSSHSHEPTK